MGDARLRCQRRQCFVQGEQAGVDAERGCKSRWQPQLQVLTGVAFVRVLQVLGLLELHVQSLAGACVVSLWQLKQFGGPCAVLKKWPGRSVTVGTRLC